MYSNFFGIDVSKSDFEVALHGHTSTFSFPNNQDGFRSFFNKFQSQLNEHALLVLENTGGYEYALLDFLLSKSLPVHRAHASMMKSFIRSLRTFGKTDKIDALSIARFAAQRHDELPLYSPPSSALRKLSRLVARRETLVQDRAREKNRLHAPGANSTEKKVTSIIIEAFDQSIALLDQECIEIIQSSDELQKKIKILKTIDGIGHVSAIAIVALMPELGSLTNKTAASLLGVAPHPFQSGQFDGYRRTKGGRYRLKSLLFMPTLSIAARSKRLENPDGLAAKYKKLINRGKKPIVAAIAILRNIIVIANARLRDAGFTS